MGETVHLSVKRRVTKAIRYEALALGPNYISAESVVDSVSSEANSCYRDLFGTQLHGRRHTVNL